MSTVAMVGRAPGAELSVASLFRMLHEPPSAFHFPPPADAPSDGALARSKSSRTGASGPTTFSWVAAKFENRADNAPASASTISPASGASLSWASSIWRAN